MSFICHKHNYTEYNQQWNVFSAKCTHTWSSGQLTMQRPGSSWGFGALLKGLASVVDNFCWSRESKPQTQSNNFNMTQFNNQLDIHYSHHSCYVYLLHIPVYIIY